MELKVLNKGRIIFQEEMRDLELSSYYINGVAKRTNNDDYYGPLYEPWEIRIQLTQSPEGEEYLFINGFLANKWEPHQIEFIHQRENLLKDIEIYAKLPIEGNDEWHKLVPLKF